MSVYTSGKSSLLLDRVYEHVKLPPIIRRAVDTPVMQRLRRVKQLGASSYLYPAATHTRFEHSIGVSHLAGQWLSALAERQPSLQITEQERIEVLLAALLHDCGHGPFSHLFEHTIMPRLGLTFHHEEMSCALATQVCTEELGLDKDAAERVTNMISGKPARDRTRSFLGQIVSNKYAIDVDRLDYMMRDSKVAFGREVSEVRPKRLFFGTGVDQTTGDIIFETKMAITLRELTSLRARLHRSVYQHPVTLRVGNMIADIIGTACEEDAALAEFVAQSVSEPALFLRLGDWIFDAISSGVYPNAKKARSLCERLDRRELYPMLGVVKLGAENFSASREDLLKTALVARLANKHPSVAQEEIKSSIIFDRVTIHHGSKEHDPLKFVKFYSPKQAVITAATLPLLQIPDCMTPSVFQEREIVAMTRLMPGSLLAREMKEVFAEVSADVGFSLPSLPSTN